MLLKIKTTKDKTKILGGKFENINADHVKNPGVGGRKTWVFTV